MYAWHLFLSNLFLINIERSFDIDLYAILNEIVSKKQDRNKIVWKEMIWLNITPAAKVFRKNVRSFSGHLKSTNAGQKQSESLGIMCSFQIWT
jgi:hypothetical protein